jgi:WD40 repeat protein
MTNPPLPAAKTLPTDLAEVVARCRALSLPRLVEELRADQVGRWRAGQRLLAEVYLNAFPALAASAEDALVLIWGEVLLRFERGETPRLAEYRHRFPQHFDALAVQFELQRHLVGPSDATLLGPPEPDHAAPQPLPEVPGYLVLGELGRGAMGVVYKARQIGLDRVVALKMVLAGTHASPEQLVRFLQEAELVAQLAHPNIVAVHQVGVHGDSPYLALEFVDGPSLAHKCAGTPQPPREAARLVEVLAAAVHEAHQHGIVHRDLKPGNVLLTSAGVPKIADFGLAKRAQGDSHLTQTGVVLGTPSYMAPEQATPRNKAVGPAADVYALGAILYELLTGRPPFQGETAWDTMQLVVSCAVVPPRRFQPKVPRDLEAICLKCLEKERARRYISARALADDLCRFLNGEPVRARATPSWDRAWRWARRRPAVAGLLATVFSLLVVIAVGGAVLSWHLKQALEEARAAGRDRTEQLWQSYVDRARAERSSGKVGQRFRALQAIRAAAKIHVTPELRDEAAAALVLADVEPAHEWSGFPDGTIGLGFDGDFQRYVRMSKQGELTVCRRGAAGEEALTPLPAHGNPPFCSPEMSPDGRFVAYRHGPGQDVRLFRVWKLDPAPAVWLEGSASHFPFALVFSPDSRWLAAAAGDGSVHIFALATHQRVQTLKTDDPHPALAFHPHRAQLAVACNDKVSLFDVATGRALGVLPHPDTVSCVAWHPDGRRLATGCDDRKIYHWDMETATQPMPPWKGHTTEGISLAYNNSGDRLVSNDWSGAPRLWDAVSGRQLLALPSSLGSRFSRDGRLFGWARAGTNVRLFRVAAGRELLALRSCHAEELEVLFDPVVDRDGRLLAACSRHRLSFFDLGSGRELASVRLPREHGVRPLRFDLDEGWLTGGHSGLLVWPVRPDLVRKGLLRIGPPRPRAAVDPTRSNGATASRDGTVLAVPQGSHTLVFHKDRAGGPLRLGPQFDVRWSVVSPDGRWVVTCSHWPDGHSRSARIWNAHTGEHIRDLPLEESTTAGFSPPDGRYLATSTNGQGCRLWEVGTWHQVRRFNDATFAFSPDGRLLALGDTFGAVRLVETETGREVARLTGPEPRVYTPACFSPDGTKLITTTTGGNALFVWDLRLLRTGLADLGLDWDWPPFPEPTTAEPTPLQISIDPGG